MDAGDYDYLYCCSNPNLSACSLALRHGVSEWVVNDVSEWVVTVDHSHHSCLVPERVLSRRAVPLTEWASVRYVGQAEEDGLSPDEVGELLRLDYAKMRAEMAPLREELLRCVMHPRNIRVAMQLALIN
jgi:hypothetical protein